jgi:DNA ligase-4
MPKSEHPIAHQQLLAQFKEHNPDLGETPGWMFHGLVVCFDKKEKTIDELNSDASIDDTYTYDLDTKLAGQIVYFAGGRLVDDLDDANVTHIVVGEDRERLKEIRGRNSLLVFSLQR